MRAKTRILVLRVAGFSYPMNFFKDKRQSSITEKIHLTCKSATPSQGSLADSPTKSNKITPPHKPATCMRGAVWDSLKTRVTTH